jgi:hypothetical protein
MAACCSAVHFRRDVFMGILLKLGEPVRWSLHLLEKQDKIQSKLSKNRLTRSQRRGMRSRSRVGEKWWTKNEKSNTDRSLDPGIPKEQTNAEAAHGIAKSHPNNWKSVSFASSVSARTIGCSSAARREHPVPAVQRSMHRAWKPLAPRTGGYVEVAGKNKYARQDSNLQPSVPKTDALSNCATDAFHTKILVHLSHF